jgi:hypothetical protein
MTGSHHIDHVQIVLDDQAVEMDVDEVEAGGGPPVAEEPRLDVLSLQRLFQQRIVLQVDLADREIVGCAPIGVHQREQFVG